MNPGDQALSIGSDWGRQDDDIAAASRPTLLHRGRHILVFHRQKRRAGIAGELSGAGAFDDGGSGAVRGFGS
jgi:hypothetical protein